MATPFSQSIIKKQSLTIEFRIQHERWHIMSFSLIVFCQKIKEKIHHPNSIVKLEPSSLMKTSHKSRWFIFCFSFKLMDMVAFKTSSIDKQ
jgi:hypothetical protein